MGERSPGRQHHDLNDSERNNAKEQSEEHLGANANGKIAPVVMDASQLTLGDASVSADERQHVESATMT